MNHFIIQLPWLFQNRISVFALIFTLILTFQIFTLPSRRAYLTQLPSSKLPTPIKRSSLNKDSSSSSSSSHQFSRTSNKAENVVGFNGIDVGKNTHTEFPNDIGDEEGAMLKVSDSDNGYFLIANSHLPVEQTIITEGAASLIQQGKLSLSDGEVLYPAESGPNHFNGGESNASTFGKKKKLVMPPLSMSEMNHLLIKNRASRRSKRPRWSSVIDREMLAAMKEIENAPLLDNDELLFAPLYRNISKFKRSYELMEKTLKIFIYEEGEKPIFHQPLLRGIYASEGWFMKFMESNEHYTVKDPNQAHLFYMPFSSRLLQSALFSHTSQNRTILRQHLNNYKNTIAKKYPFWNRTGGADHFLAACHDWALYETKKTMDHCIRALCVSDLSIGFELGRDVSLPETNILWPNNPLKDLGGRPWNRRPILAFFAGNLHGELRSVLLERWEDKEPDMKIFGPSTFRLARKKMKYIQFMKSSKYCICPRGFEANSPRLVEAIFFECVPVIIADGYVPPFFEVLNWEKFSVIVAEKDVDRLKEILVSISELKYRELQMGVKKVQKHFLWHIKPVKYDLFHMILHSIWLNRVYNLKI